MHYVGKWDEPNAALEKWLAEEDDLLAGRTPRPSRDGLTVADLCNNRLLTPKRHFVDTRELAARSFVDYHATCKIVVEHFGARRLVEDLAADDFESIRKALAKNRGPVTLGNEIQRIRVLCKYA